MSDERMEEKKMKEVYRPISLDEVFLLLFGIEIFSFPFLSRYKIIFIIGVIIWYWVKIRLQETKIHKKEQEIYNVFYTIASISQLRSFVEKRTDAARKPMNYELEQLKNQRKFLVDKFVVINLILLVLIQLLIR